MTTATATRPQRTRKSSKTAYEPVALARVYDKQSGACLGYLAPSRNGKDWYQVNSDDNARWHCNCLAGQHNQECCHIAAVKEQCKRRVEMGLPGCKEPAPTSGTNDSYSLPDSVTQVIEEVMQALDESPAEELLDEEDKWKQWMDELGREEQKAELENEPLVPLTREQYVEMFNPCGLL